MGKRTVSTESAFSLDEASSPMSGYSRRSTATPTGTSRDMLWAPASPSPFNPAHGGGSGGEKDGEKPKKYIKQYELGHTLGKGSYAKVKICYDTEEHNRVPYAIKIFNKSLLKRRRMWSSAEKSYKTAFDDVLREIAIMRKLEHENVMRLKDVIDDASINKLYMVMDYCKRGAIMDSHDLPTRALPHDDCRRWFTDAVAGLAYLHYQDIVHFDLKPDNILIADDNRAVISDFGVSRTILTDTSDEQNSDGKGGLTVGSPGTPSYTAPEVWGQSKYEAKGADVWALGVTLHAMATGTLPFFTSDQQKLIEMVTAPDDWTPANITHDDVSLLDLLSGILKKKPEERLTLERIKQHPYVKQELAARQKKDTDEYQQITVDEEELRKAVISGHIENFRRTPRGTLHKTTELAEHAMYRKLADSEAANFLPKLIDVKETLGKRVIIEMEDLTHAMVRPCLMDIKMGARTFIEEEASATSLRSDLLEKMLKVDASAATEEEKKAGGITKMRYLQFRERSTSSATLGFRIDAVRLADGVDAPCLDVSELRTLTTEPDVAEAVLQYVQSRPSVLRAFAAKLRQIRSVLDTCDTFMMHSFIRTSILLIYSDETGEVSVNMIDLSRAYAAGRRLTHRDAWMPGNHEDGYLTGLDNLIRIFDKLVEQTMAVADGL